MIIAVDVDGVLCDGADFPKIGHTNYEMIALVQELIDMGHEVVLWTSRNGDELKSAVEWCEWHGLHFCAVNEPAPSNNAEYADRYPTPTRKIYADVYIDDHNLEFVAEGREGYNNLKMYLKRIMRRTK